MPRLAIKKLGPKRIILSAARHVLREIQAELGADAHIDASRMHLNQVLAGPPSAAEVDALALSLMQEAGIVRLRRDSVRAIEVLVSLSPGEQCDDLAFFTDSVQWARDYFEGAPVLSAVVHRDEATPHCHVLILPLVRGRMNGSDLVGGPSRLVDMQSSFHAVVCAKYGFARKKTPRRIGAAVKRRCASDAMTRLLSNPAAIRIPDVKTALKSLIEANPVELLEALGLPLPEPTRKQKTFVEIMTQPCRPEKGART